MAISERPNRAHRHRPLRSAAACCTPEVFQHHDQISRESLFNVGGGAAFTITDTIDLFVAYRRTVTGRNTHAINRGLSIGMSWSFGRPAVTNADRSRRTGRLAGAMSVREEDRRLANAPVLGSHAVGNVGGRLRGGRVGRPRHLKSAETIRIARDRHPFSRTRDVTWRSPTNVPFLLPRSSIQARHRS